MRKACWAQRNEPVRLVATTSDHCSKVRSSNGMPRVLRRGATARRNFGRLGCALNRPTWSPVKGSSARVSPNRLSYGCPTTIFLDHPTDTDIISAQHFWTGGLETAGPGCYDAVAIARAAGFRMVVMSRIRHATRFLNCSEPAKKSGQNIPKNRCRTTVAERMMETPTELPFIGGRLLKPRTRPPAATLKAAGTARPTRAPPALFNEPVTKK